MKPSHLKEPSSGESKKYTLIRLFKFGKEEYMKDLYEKGAIFCHSIHELRQGDDFRMDSYEGVSTVETIMPGSMLIADHPTIGRIELKVKEGSFITYSEITHGNICAFYSLSGLNFSEGNTVVIDKRMGDFGSHVVLIHDVIEFKRRILKRADELGVKVHMTFVEYYDPLNHIGKVNIFQKKNAHGYQHEFRLYVERDNADSYKFEIGGIADIAELRTSEFALKCTFSKISSAE